MSLFYIVLFLVMILLLGIFLAPFLGGNKEGLTDMSSNILDISSNLQNTSSNSTSQTSGSYDNYNHYTGSSKPTLTNSTFYGQNGSTLAVNMNGANTLTTTDTNGKSIIYAGVPAFDGTVDSFMGPNGSVAVIVEMNNGNGVIAIKDTGGNETIYSSNPPTSGQDTFLPNITPSSTQSTLIAPNTTNSSNLLSPISSSQSSVRSSSYNYSSSLPQGISASQIPPGHEDLYILKTEVVPPVCPVCPVQTSRKKCPPCPACTRCPEPAYDCKLVPNYSSMNVNSPVPVLNDFSTFGM